MIFENGEMFVMWRFDRISLEFSRVFVFFTENMVEDLLISNGLFHVIIQRNDASFEIQTHDDTGTLLMTRALTSPFPDPCVLLTHLYPFVLEDNLYYAFVQFDGHVQKDSEKARKGFLGVYKHHAENLLFFRGDKASAVCSVLQKPWNDDWLMQSDEKKIYLLPGATTEKIIRSIAQVSCHEWDEQKPTTSSSLYLTRTFIRQRFSYVSPHYPNMLHIVSVFFDPKSNKAWAHEGCARQLMII
jgi:hypothetical protein